MWLFSDSISLVFTLMVMNRYFGFNKKNSAAQIENISLDYSNNIFTKHLLLEITYLNVPT